MNFYCLLFIPFHFAFYLNNYDKSLICKICHEQIKDSSNWDYLHLYAEDNEHFITFYFRCAFKRHIVEKFGDITGEFDYFYYNNNYRN
ncbi:MAG: hypothetical protein ACFFA3_13195 [Promethearchaeota archaeon]